MMRTRNFFLLGSLLIVSLGLSPAFAADFSKWNPMHYFQKVDETQKAPIAEKEPVKKAAAPKQLAKPAKPKKATQPEIKTDKKAEKAPKPTPGAMIETEKGNIVIELYPDQAPTTVQNFVSLVEQNFYNSSDMKFHRVVPGFVIQTGDPTGTGSGGSPKTIPLEAKNKLSHNAKGIVAMARGLDPNSARSQFYITLAPQPALDGKYAIFGKVISGLDVLPQIRKGDRLYGVRLIDTATVPRDKKVDDKKGLGQGFKNLFNNKAS